MNLEEVKKAVYNMTAMFFQGATVIWAEQINTLPPLPYVTLKLSGIHKTEFPVMQEDGSRYYSCQTTAEFNLYTRGRPVTVGNQVTGNYANTAVSDMMNFFKFMESEYGTDRLAENGLDILLLPPIRDLTSLQNDNSSYRYRSMAEATISWSEEADGAYGISSMPIIPDSSGGGTLEIAQTPIESIEGIDIQYEKEEEESG